MLQQLTRHDLESKIKDLEQEIAKIKWEGEALKEREELFRNLIEGSVHGILIHYDLKPLFLNQAFADIFDLTSHEILGMETIQELFASYEHSRLQEHSYEKLKEQSISIQEEYHGRRKDGTLIWLEVRETIANWGGEPAIQMTVTDITNQKKTKEALRGTEERYQKLVENFPYGVFRVTPETSGKFIMVNPAFTRMFGYSEEEALEEIEVSAIFTDKDDYQTITDSLMSKNNISGVEVKLLKKDDTPIWSLISASVQLVDGSEEMAYFDFTVEDITERKKAEEALRKSEEQFRDLIENSLQGIIIHDHMKPLFVNYAFTELYGYTDDEILGMDSMFPLLAPEEHERISDYTRAHQNDENAPIQFEYQGIRRDGAVIWLESWVMKINWNGIPAIQSTVSDITFRKKSEKVLRKAKTDIEAANLKQLDINKKLEEAIDKAKEMAAQADKANKAKTKFLDKLSRDIRTPINGIIGMAGLLSNTNLEQKQSGYVDEIQVCAENQLSIINDILDFSAIESGDIVLEQIDFDIKTMVEDLSELMASKAHEKKLVFACLVHHDVPLALRGDPGRLRQVLMNLSDNAIKFTDKGEIVIRVSVEKETEMEAFIRFSVSDTGIGIPKRKLKELFKASTADEDGETESTGMGLTIAKQLTELMGGKINVESVPGKGSKFWFTVKIGKQSPDREDTAIMPADIRKKRIIAVESNQTFREVLSAFLKHWNCRFEAVSTGYDTLTLMKNAVENKDPYHLAIIDHNPTEIDGEELGKTIKNDPALKDTVLVMLSSYGQRGDAARAKDIGFAAYFTKPIQRSQLFDCLVTVLAEPMNGAKQSLVTRHTLIEAKKRRAMAAAR